MVIRQSGAKLRGLASSPARERATAYFAGRQAAERQLGENSCPYEDETRRRVWLLGWRSAVVGDGERRAAALRP
jgi:ribosome modulation factor